MGIKWNEEKQSFEVSVSKRDKLKRQPRTMKWILNESGKPIKTEAEARRVQTKMIIELENRINEKSVPRWKTMIEKYCESALNRGLLQITVENYRLGLNAHTLEPWGNRRIDTIQPEEIRNLIKAKLGHRSPSHQKSVLKFIRAIFSFAVEAGYISRNPAPEIKFKIGDKIKTCLTESQLGLLLNRAKEMDCEWYEIWAVASYCGLRSGELYALTWDKVNFDTRLIKVDSSWNNKDGFKSTKSGDDRMVEIPEALLPLLRDLKIQNYDSKFVLPRLEKWKKGEQARELRMFLMGLNLPPIRFHDLRASWATMLLSRGVEPIKVMYSGGWKDLKTMMIYMRKSGVNIRGMTDGLQLHNPSREQAKVINLGLRSES
ncbi:MAG: tyrosine-type recombinase/integrase [Bdellovibrionota bacterium]